MIQPTKRLLIVSTVAETLETFLVPYGQHFRRLGWEVDAAARGIADSSRCRETFDEVFDIPWSRYPRDLARQLRSLRVMRHVLREGSYDIVHMHTPVASLLTRVTAAMMGRSTRPVLVYTAHGFHFHPAGSAVDNFAYVALERLGSLWTDYLVVLNEEDRRQALSLSLAPPPRLWSMPGIGIDLDTYRPTTDPAVRASVRQELGIADDAPLLLMVAEFNAEKHHREALVALSLMKGTASHFAFAGTGPLEEEIRRLGRDLALSDRLHFLGFRADVPILMNAADALVSTSSREGLPRSVLEAQAIGLPVVGTDIRGIRDLLDQDRGTLVPLGDTRLLTAALEQLVADPTEARRQADRAMEVIGRYEIGALLGQHEELYEEALHSR